MNKTALLLLLLITLPVAHADNHTIGEKILNGLQEISSLVTDIIVDITQDVSIIIPGQRAITAEVPPPPVYDLTPKTPGPKVTRGELPAHAQGRRDEFRQKKPKKAPKDRELPPFTMVLTEEIEEIISRGTIFSVSEMNIMNPPERTVASNGAPIPADHTSRIIHNDLAQAVRLGGKGGTTPHRMIVLHKRSAQTSSLEGEVYGNMLFTNISFAQVDGLPVGPTSPYLLVTIDTPIQAMAAAADTLIQGPLARNTSGALGAVGVCLIDTGIDHTLPVFANNYVGGTDFVNNDEDPLDDDGHGTRMAHAIVTVAPGAQLYVAKALDNTGAGYSSDAIQAIDWCMQQNVSVITMSFGGGTFDGWCDGNFLAQKANEAVTRGFFVVAAAGNDPYAMQSPACASLVTSVGATDTTANETIWAGSGLSNVTDILAPGVNLQVQTLGGGTTQSTGTSVSAAIVAGAGAVIEEATAMNPQPLQDLLRSTGVLFNSTENRTYPRVDLYRALTNQTNSMDLTQSGTQSDDTVGRIFKSDACYYMTDIGNDPCDGSVNGVNCQACINCLNYMTGGCNNFLCDETLNGGDPTEDCSPIDESAMCTNAVGSWPGCTTDRCSTAGDQDQDGWNDGCDANCGGAQQCASGTCCNTADCSFYGSGTEGTGCAACTQCSGGSASCVNIGSGSTDTTGSNQCTAGPTGCEYGSCACDGSGNCDITDGNACDNHGQCLNNICKSNYFQGSDTPNRCTNANSNCVDSGGNLRANTYNAGSDTCYGSAAGDSVWLANSGRWVVRNTGSTVLAVIDKYGSMGVRGSTTTSAGSFDSGWQLNSAGTKASISSSTGNLRTAGGITEGQNPSCTGFQVRNTGGTIMACWSTAGNLQVRGDYADNLGSLA